MSKHKTYRVNVSLKHPHGTVFIEHLTQIRKAQIERQEINLISASELARDLIVKALSPSREEVEPVMKDRGISIDVKGRGTIRVPKNVVDQIGISKGDRVDVHITKHKAQST